METLKTILYVVAMTLAFLAFQLAWTMDAEAKPPLKVLAIGDCHTGFNGGTDLPHGAYWWAWFPELIKPRVEVVHASWPGTTLYGWSGLGALRDEEGRATFDLYYWGAMKYGRSVDVVVSMLGGHDVRVGVTPEQFQQAIEAFHQRIGAISNAKAWVIVLQASPNVQQREKLQVWVDLERAYCEAHAEVFCSVDLRDEFALPPSEFYGASAHWNGLGHEKAARAIAPTVQAAIRYARKHRKR